MLRNSHNHMVDICKILDAHLDLLFGTNRILGCHHMSRHLPRGLQGHVLRRTLDRSINIILLLVPHLRPIRGHLCHS